MRKDIFRFLDCIILESKLKELIPTLAICILNFKQRHSQKCYKPEVHIQGRKWKHPW